MQFITSKTGIATTLLISVFVFLYFFTGVFGDTRIGLTLRSNSDLENGLVAHYTFDARDVNGFTVSDSAGSNDGVIVATSSVGSEVLISTDADGDSSFQDIAQANQVWISDDIGYVFWRTNGEADDVAFASTTDGGATWSGQIDIESSESESVAVWYDKWTPENESNPRYIHIALLEVSSDQMYYVQYDTQTDTFSSEVRADNGNIGNTITGQGTVITQARDGALYMTVSDNTGNETVRCAQNCTSSTNWVTLADPYDQDEVMVSAMVPIINTDNVALIYDGSGGGVWMNVYSATSSSWWGVRYIEDYSNSLSEEKFSATYHPKTGTIYVTHLTDADDFVTQDHDVRIFTIDPITFATSSLTNPITDASGGLTGVKTIIDANRSNDVYTLYTRRTTISDSTTGNVYYRYSNDGGTIWSGEIGPLNQDDSAFEGVQSTIIAYYRIAATVVYSDGAFVDDIYFIPIEDIGDYAQDKVINGNIGQGMTFDGVDDYVNLGSDASLDDMPALTACSWLFFKSSQTNSVIFTKYSGSSGFWLVDIQSGSNKTIQFTEDWASGNISVTSAVSSFRLNEWTHFCISWNGGNNSDGSDARIYINGIDSYSGSTAGGTDSYSDASNNLLISNSSNPFDGMMDDVRIYNRALSASEITRLYDLGATTKIAKTLSTNPDLEDGLELHYTFDARNLDFGSSTAELVDESGNGNNGNIRNHASTSVPGAIGQALSFDGVDDYAGTPEFSGSEGGTELTVATWIRRDEYDVAHRLVTKERSGFRQWVLDINGFNTPTFSVATSTGEVLTWTTNSGPDYFMDKTWHHIVGVYDDVNTYLYIDGALIATTSAGGGAIRSDYSHDICLAGEDTGGGCGSSDNIDLDDVRIYSRALSAEEVTRLYQLGATTKVSKTVTTNPDLENGLVGHWTFDGPDTDWGSTTAEILDRSGNNWNGNAETITISKSRIGKIGQSLKFRDDLNDRILVDNFDVATHAPRGTASFWMQTDFDESAGAAGAEDFYPFAAGTGGETRHFGLRYQARGGTDRYVFYTSNGSIGSILWDTPNDIVGWHHYVLTWDMNGKYLYQDGIQVESFVGDGRSTTTTQGLVLGNFYHSNPSNSDRALFGRMDDFRLYNRVLSTDEILRLYQLGN